MGDQKTRLLLILLALAAALHFVELSEPRGVVFDEVHFGGFADAYCCSGRYFFDIHPPLAKLLIAGGARLGGYRGGQSFEDLNTPFETVSPTLFRFVPALAGTLLPAVMMLLLLQLGASPLAAFLGGLATALDNALLVQTRVIALDGVLLLATFGALTSFLVAIRAPSRARRTAFALLCGALCGLAAGTKFTGLAALGLIGLCLAVEFLRKPSLPRLRVGASLSAWILAGAAAVYLSGWALHFALLAEPGPGFIWGPPTGDFLLDTVRVHRNMLASNYGLTASHPYSSPWWSWPLMARSVFYWSDANASIYLLGNPVVWWGTTLGLILMAGSLLLLRATDLTLPGRAKPWPPRLWIPALGYGIALLPLMPVPRALFLYHYMTPLLFGLCGVVLWLDHVGFTRPGGFASQRTGFKLSVAALLLGFLVISPLTFSFVRTPTYQAALFGLFPGWR